MEFFVVPRPPAHTGEIVYVLAAVSRFIVTVACRALGVSILLIHSPAPHRFLVFFPFFINSSESSYIYVAPLVVIVPLFPCLFPVVVFLFPVVSLLHCSERRKETGKKEKR